MNARKILIDEQDNLELFQSVAEFNLYLVRYIHPSWLKTVKLSPLLRQLGQGGHADFHLSNFLLKEFHLDDEFDYDFELPAKRIALADETTLLKLALNLGIVLNESVIRNVIKRQEKQALEDCLGAEEYRFAVKKAQFISRAEEQAGPSILIDWEHLNRFKSYLITTGLQVMGKAVESCTDAYKKRLELKLPRYAAASLCGHQKISMSVDQCQSLVVKAHKEVNKEWRHLLS